MTQSELTVQGLHLLVPLKLLNIGLMNQEVCAFRRYPDASLRHKIQNHDALAHNRWNQTVVAKD